jgi:uncharacterized protein YidB (DUF937 family)
MSRGYPSGTALLALLAVAGYQNRDKIAEWIGSGQRNPGATTLPPQSGASAAPPGNGGTTIGGLLSDGLRDLVNAFKQKGEGDTADSWVARGPNKAIAPSQLEQVIGPNVVETLSRQTGLSREEILSRLSKTLPDAVDKYTPDGRIPTLA